MKTGDPKKSKKIKKNNSSILSRIIHFPLIKIILGILMVNVSTFILRSLAQFILSSFSIQNNIVNSIVTFFVRLIAVYYAYNLFVKIFERRKAHEVSINISALKEFAYGGLLGLSIITAVMTFMWMSGNFFILGLNTSATLWQSYLHNFFFAFLQDIVYFAIIYRIFEKHLGTWFAIVIASIIFGFKHLLFPEYTIWSVITQTFEAGILFSALFILTRNIWMIFGFHFFWNFVVYGLILGFEAEGLVSLFIPEFTGSNLITGMPVGPEASIVTCVIGTAVGIFFLIRAYKKDSFILPFWKRTDILTPR